MVRSRKHLCIDRASKRPLCQHGTHAPPTPVSNYALSNLHPSSTRPMGPHQRRPSTRPPLQPSQYHFYQPLW
jgi:hypothetical protein